MFFPSYLNFIIKSRSHRRAESEELINQIISVDRRQNVEGQTRQLKKMHSLVPFFNVTPFHPPSDYVFVTPVEVNSDGGFLSHDVAGRSHRARRSLSPSVHYRLSAFGQDMQLDLHPSSVVGPGFTVQSLGSEGITTVTDDAGFHNCLYQGFVRNLSSSSAALSTCSGLVSVCIFLIQYLWFCYLVWLYSCCVFCGANAGWSVLSVMRGLPLI